MTSIPKLQTPDHLSSSLSRPHFPFSFSTHSSSSPPFLIRHVIRFPSPTHLCRAKEAPAGRSAGRHGRLGRLFHGRGLRPLRGLWQSHATRQAHGSSLPGLLCAAVRVRRESGRRLLRRDAERGLRLRGGDAPGVQLEHPRGPSPFARRGHAPHLGHTTHPRRPAGRLAAAARQRHHAPSCPSRRRRTASTHRLAAMRPLASAARGPDALRRRPDPLHMSHGT